VVDITFVPNALIGFPEALSHGTIKETVLRAFLSTRAAYLALGGDSHEPELGADQEALVEGEPDEGAHFSWAGAMP